VGPAAIGEIILLASLFHIPAILVNDLRDVAIDRNDPMRAGSPLVLGTISTRATWLVAIVSAAAMTLLPLLLFPGAVPVISLLAGLAAMTVYNIWGKYCLLPVATDLVQGIGWAALAYFGAAVTGGEGRLTYCLCAALVVYTMLANVYGGLRDLRPDRAGNGFTTVMLLGAHEGADAPVISRSLGGYIVMLHCVLLGMPVFLLLEGGEAVAVTAVLALVLFLAELAIACHALRGVNSKKQLHALGAANLTTGFAGIAMLSATAQSSLLAVVAFLIFLLPMCVNLAFRDMVRLSSYASLPGG
jgi:4-hydroxybenzoate polyprenyltransferase